MRRLALATAVLLGTAGLLASGACADLTNLAGGGPGGDASLAVALTPASLDFGVAGCGTSVPPQTVALENNGPTPIAFEASLPEASGFALGGQQLTTTSGTLPPGGRTAFTIAVAALRTLGQLKTKLSIKMGDELREVPITVTGLGAKLDADRQLVDFGDVYYTTTATADVTLSNPGTEDVTVTSVTNLGPDFAVAKSVPRPLLVPKGGSAKLALELGPGAASAALTRDLTFETDGKPLCGDKPTLTVRARRVSTEVTINPGTVDFGKLPCGSVPAAQTVTITNYGVKPAVVQTTAVPGSRFVIPTGMAIVPALDATGPGKATFTVKAVAVTAPLGIVTESIPFTIDGAPRTLAARFEPRGVILDFTPTYWNFSFAGQKRVVIVGNSGNENAVTTYTPDSPAFTPGPGDTIFANTKSSLEITYTPPDPNPIYKGTVTTNLPPGVTACAPVAKIMVETK
jgi:hypothetical protein